MGDCPNETLQFIHTHDDSYARLLDGSCLALDEDDSIPWILDHIDCFGRQARLNETIQTVHFSHVYSSNNRGGEDWDKVGQAIGNLQALNKVCISTFYYEDDDDLPISDWEILARILSHVRQKIEIIITGAPPLDAEASRLFAEAIHGHPTITSFVEDKTFPYESLDVLYAALATLPALESIILRRKTMPEDESALAHPESLTELLRAPSLRSVLFVEFNFTLALCQATANALMEGTAITKLEFTSCSFSAGECALIMANGLSRNTSVSQIEVVSPNGHDHSLLDALATILPLNSTLQDLSFLCGSPSAEHLSPFVLALERNVRLKTLKVDVRDAMDESLCAALKDGLGMNTALESLELNRIELTDDNFDLWCRALSFLRTHKALKSLMVTLDHNVTESRAIAFSSDVLVMLQDNVSLESLTIFSWKEIQAEKYIALITALQLNRTLKSLRFQRIDFGTRVRLTNDEDKQMAALLQKNYALESLPDVNHQGGDVGAILRLNEAGRRYLVQDGAFVSEGVEVLSVVSNEINCVFLHLLENPRLCDRSAVEAASDIPEGNRVSTSSANHNGKREQNQDQALKEGKGSRRRRT